MFCPNCGTSNRDGVEACGQCGFGLTTSELSRPVVGKQLMFAQSPDVFPEGKRLREQIGIEEGAWFGVVFCRELSAAEYLQVIAGEATVARGLRFSLRTVAEPDDLHHLLNHLALS